MRLFLLWGLFWINTGLYAEKIKVIVSIPPQQFMLESIAGDWLEVQSLVQAGQNPENWSPKPQQLKKIAQARYFFEIGLPFEQVWQKKIKRINPHIQIMPFYNESKQQHHIDPHIWLDPLQYLALLKQTKADLIQQVLPQYQTQISQKSAQFKQQIERLDKKIRQQFKQIKRPDFWVYHPAWGHFSQRYGLTQIAIEHEGKSPSAHYLTRLIKKARQTKVKTIFVQPQMNHHKVHILAQSIGASIEVIDPLALNYIQNMQFISLKIARALH